MKQIKEIRIEDQTEKTVSITFIFEDDTEETAVMKVSEFKKLLDKKKEMVLLKKRLQECII